MKRRDAGVAVGVLAIVASVLAWRCHQSRSSGGAGPTEASGSARGKPAGSNRRVADPHQQPRGSISGTIKDERGAPLAGARACANLWGPGLADEDTRDPICVYADAHGAYRIGDAVAAFYTVDGMAAERVPARYASGDETTFWLAAGEHKTGVDIVLAGGAVALRGTVSDISGGPVARA